MNSLSERYQRKFCGIFACQSNNIQTYGTTQGNASLFGSDIQQAQDVTKFRNSYCTGISSGACDKLVTEALNDRKVRVGIFMLTTAVIPGVINSLRTLRLPTGGGIRVSTNAGTTGEGVTGTIVKTKPDVLLGANNNLIGDIDPATGKVTTTPQITTTTTKQIGTGGRHRSVQVCERPFCWLPP
ncbi:MAG: hypothetical protein KGM99_09145 [Burkholderiales bacterium]|nr:hypothetical protein [Burkholderiales bacterium]